MWNLVGILGLALLMVVHESGHYFAARAFGMHVTKFSIGFGPTFFKIVPKDGYFWFITGADKIQIRLWKHDPERHGPTIYQVAMIPFLAYVQIAGMNPFEDNDPNDKHSYANASLTGRISTIFAGPLANYLFASVFFFGAFMLGGVPSNEAYVTPLEGKVAIAAGIREGDKVVEVAGTPIQTWGQMAEQISKRPGEPIHVVVERDKQRVTLDMTPANENGTGRIGVTAFEQRVAVTPKEAAKLAVTEPANVVKMLVVSLGQLITGKVEGELSGPVGMVKHVANAAKRGTAYGLHLLGALSAYLGAFNLIPLPALDGGRLMFLTYEATTRRRPNARIEAWIHAMGILMFLGLMLWVTVFKDLGLGSK
ncbi:MAG: site-2 protease family protein [Polyangiaceae bacterium]|nr:site-2 protease family protein [Polyangiaceae bacterium]